MPSRRQNFSLFRNRNSCRKIRKQLFISRRQETLAFQQATIQNLQTLQTYLKSGEYDKIQNYLPAITDNFQKERFHPICHDSLINAILADKRFLALQKNVKISYEILLPEKSCIPSSELSSIFFNLLDNGLESCSTCGLPEPVYFRDLTHVSWFSYHTYAKQQRPCTNF